MSVALVVALAASGLTSSAPPGGVSVRLARRSDLLPLALLVSDSFAAEERFAEITYESARTRGWLERQVTTARVALDIERRLTPWDWCRHAQLVAEDADGKILGFAELWGEDGDSLRNVSALTPQPAIFNLCVATAARRRGVAQALLERCETVGSSWGDGQLYLKVREDNEAACQLYTATGWETLEVRARSELAAWQERWKGGSAPLRLMRKPLPNDDVDYVPAKTFSEFGVTLKSVLEYNDRDALIWFTLLILRNVKMLTPAYRIFPALAALATWGLYYLVIKVASTPSAELPLFWVFESH